MQYRKFGRLDFEVSTLGFGCMRLPIIDNDESKIDEKEAIHIIRYGIDHGINYIDTAYPYHKGNSEILVGKALKDGYREKVKLATKLPVWLTNTYEDFDKYLNEQLKKLGTDSIDFYLLHTLNERWWHKVRDLGVLNFLDQALKDGRIKYAGFSFHDEVKIFKEIVDAYDWSFCQIQLNYMDEHYQAGIEGLHYAASKNLAVVIMEPLKGGRLAIHPPEEVIQLWNTTKIKQSPAAWALKWVCNHPEVSVVLSGMGTLDQVIENIKIIEDAYPNSLTELELTTIHKVKEKYNELMKVPCTGCGYCMPCPNKVDIPGNFALYNDAFMYNTLEKSISEYHQMKERKRASACITCGKCLEACPQNISIIEYLKDVDNTLGKKY